MMIETDLKTLRDLQYETFCFFMEEMNHCNGLIPDRTEPSSPASIASVGMGLSCFTVAVKKGWLKREQAVKFVLTTLRFFDSSRQGTDTKASGYKGFYYHFLDMKSGERHEDCEVSTIDTALLMAGVLSAGGFFDGHDPQEIELREIADRLYRRVDWAWALNGKKTLTHGWKPETGFLPSRWDEGYSEALILYILAMGSPTHAITSEGYREWTAKFQWRELYGFAHFYAGPLFIHQLSQLWIDFRDLQDDVCRQRNIDYFENSRRAVLMQRAYAIENPRGFEKYSAEVFGFTASDGPGRDGKNPTPVKCGGEVREFFGYIARGAPDGPDDGTISPWVVVASVPFAPEAVMPAINHTIGKLKLHNREKYGMEASFNLTCRDQDGKPWVSPWRYGINQGPIVLMIENFENEFFWELMKKCPYVRTGLSQGGFRGAWLDDSSAVTSANAPTKTPLDAP